ncbi:hypothetical protein FQA47_018485 [Oryzias melastigma]|uniref:Uncharacterized protein n=1 Tax=Oryzias melastigma TaxID=30732 RepID=A0A834F2L6_ORYME|nr:hypothetical protein FQA47_018485 [Oryzias melastigma]
MVPEGQTLGQYLAGEEEMSRLQCVRERLQRRRSRKEDCLCLEDSPTDCGVKEEESAEEDEGTCHHAWTPTDHKLRQKKEGEDPRRGRGGSGTVDGGERVEIRTGRGEVCVFVREGVWLRNQWRAEEWRARGLTWPSSGLGASPLLGSCTLREGIR